MNLRITRRQFLQYCTASAAALGLSQMDLLKLEKALATPQTGCTSYSVPSVVWMEGQNCSGCQTSLLNRVVQVSGGYYDADMINALYTALAPFPQSLVGQGTPNDVLPELQVVNDVADLLVGDAVSAVVPQLSALRSLSWAPFRDGYITLEMLHTVQAGAGDINVGHLATVVNAGGFVLLMDGSIPTDLSAIATPTTQTRNEKFCFAFDNIDSNGNPALPGGSTRPDGTVIATGASVTIADALRWMVPSAAACIAVGTCAAFGGIPAGKRNRTGATPLKEFLDAEFGGNPGDHPAVINVSGCPPHPDWIVFPVAHFILTGQLPMLTADSRPADIFNRSNCDNCKKNQGLCATATCLGDDGCLENLGCKGAGVNADCSGRQKNNYDDGTVNNWCVGNPDCSGTGAGIGDARHPCQGCTEPDFPDFGGFYSKTMCVDCN